MEGYGVEVELLVPVEGEGGAHLEHEAARRGHGAGEAVEQDELQPPGAVVVQRGGRRARRLLVGTPESCVISLLLVRLPRELQKSVNVTGSVFNRTNF